ncbi:MAG: sulfatase [Gammaproteobacteria bacterium]|nr:sulfatase [Gammaproteobacteria bacterium]MDH4255439.1 sulfatase [Gammaproteobacteria bacterium]MDH5311754.1 sulfatase [Gammaproteobacteria bacterium]
MIVSPGRAMLLVVFIGYCCAVQAAEPAADARPNVVVIVVDDLRFDEFGAAGHPYLETPSIDRLAAEGAMFTEGIHAVALCSPNRASILTGQYPTRHGIIDNVARDRRSHQLVTFPQAMQAAGYETGFLGKWHMGNDPTPRPGFDYWSAFPGQGRTVDPDLYEDGRLHKVEGYITDLLTDRAVDFINKERDVPFLLYIGHKAVHPDSRQLNDGSVDPNYPRGYVPAPRHLGVYEDEVFPRRPNVAGSADALEGKPALRQSLQLRDSPPMLEQFGFMLDHGTSEETIRRRAEMVLSVDESLGRIIAALEQQGELDNTMIVFTSDNGFFFGEHWLSLERRMPYEEAVRMPLLVRFPPLARAGSRVDGLVSSIDIAPTVLDAGGAEIGAHIQGRSLLPLLRGNADGWRDALLIEFYTHENPMPWLMDMDYRAVRTERYKLVHWIKHPDEEELYDLETDPYEMQNLVNDPKAQGVLRELRVELARLAVEAMGLSPGR